MDITWEEFQAVAPHLDDMTQLRVMNAVLAVRLGSVTEQRDRLIEQLVNRAHTIERLEEDLRDTNGSGSNEPSVEVPPG